jgi:putative membrane fusion protein
LKEKNKEEINNKKVKKNKSSIKPKSIIITLIFIIIACYAIWSVARLLRNPSNTFVVSEGKLSKEETEDGYIVREETVVNNASQNNNMVKIKQEGERVAKGDSMFKYSSTQEQDLENKIAELDTKIQSAMQENDNTFSSDKKLLEEQIENELGSVYQNNNMQKVQEYKKNINMYITKKAKIVGELSPSGSYLKKLIDERSEYEKQLDNASQYVEAPISGMVSYKIDGLESVLLPTNFSNLNKEFLENLNIKTGQTIVSNTTQGKIVNNYCGYIIFNSSSDEAKSSKVNDKITIKTQSSNENTAIIRNIIEESDGSRTIALEVNKEIEELIEYRKISFDIIWWEASGFRVPNSAIKEINGIKYVVRNRNGYLNDMPVKILKQNDEYCIVSGYSRSELIELGLSSNDIANLKTITLYDRIQLNAY